MVMTGMRVQVGTQAIERAPSYVEVFGRTMQINLTRARWFDFPFTREEALQADKKLSIFSKCNCGINYSTTFPITVFKIHFTSEICLAICLFFHKLHESVKGSLRFLCMCPF